MPASVYSVRFAAVKGGTVPHSDTVPTGRVWILRDLDVVAVSGSSPVFSLQGSEAQDIWIVTGTSLAGNLWAGWRGRQILNAGESFTCNPASGTFDYTLSGYDLTAS